MQRKCNGSRKKLCKGLFSSMETWTRWTMNDNADTNEMFAHILCFFLRHSDRAIFFSVVFSPWMPMSYTRRRHNNPHRLYGCQRCIILISPDNFGQERNCAFSSIRFCICALWNLWLEKNRLGWGGVVVAGCRSCLDQLLFYACFFFFFGFLFLFSLLFTERGQSNLFIQFIFQFSVLLE